MRPYAALAALDTALAATGRDRARRLTKPLLMPALVAARAGRSRTPLALGGLGDVALLGHTDGAFTAGLAAFLAGHLAWIRELRPRSAGLLHQRPVAATPYLLAWAGLNAFLWPRTGRDRLPVLAYSTALLGTALVALDTGDPKTAAGGALFLVSDTLLALERFAGVTLPAHEGLVMATYTSAQALLSSPGTAGR